MTIDPTEVGFLTNFVLLDQDAEFEVQVKLINTGNMFYEFQGVPSCVPEPGAHLLWLSGTGFALICVRPGKKVNQEI